ncbi:MAG TPA: 2-dehydro-3-deoxygalactonokinase [Dongiaceae bacterium]|nr:2-dehydro-3-deoxygalactonokinase [Dongiaceae bacterium]
MTAVSNTRIDCIVADWGTSNRRAWALSRDGAVLDERHDDKGLLAHADRQFAPSFQTFCNDWLTASPKAPVIMAGMVGSKMGWQEVPYQMAPMLLRELSQHLAKVQDPDFDRAWIVPGVAVDNDIAPEVMRGEECQVLAGLLRANTTEGVFLLPGTHSKWALAEAGSLTRFRTYMTGETFGLWRKSGTLSQLMEGDVFDETCFRRGVQQAGRPDAANLLHSLFSVRTLGLFERLPRTGLASYMSGVLIGAEVNDASQWLYRLGIGGSVTAIGSPGLLKSYRLAAEILGLNLVCLDSADLLPVALLELAKTAGLLPAA